MSLVFCLLKPWTWTFDSYARPSYIVLSCAIWAETACLCILLLIRFAVIVANVMDESSAALAEPFDFFAMSNGDSNIDRLIDRLYPGLCSGYLRVSSVRNHVGSQVHSRDRHWLLFLLRSSGILVVAISLLAVLFTNLVLEPLQEIGMTPMKLVTTSMFPSGFEDDNINWRIILVSEIFVLKMCLFRTVTTCCWQIYYSDTLNEESKLPDAVQVKAIWNNESGTSLASH